MCGNNSDINLFQKRVRNTCGRERMLFLVSRRMGFSICVAVVIFGTIMVALTVLPATYESSAKIVVDPPGSEAFSLQVASQSASEPDYIETQALILRSGGVGIEVVRSLNLERNPLVMRKSWFEAAMDKLHMRSLLMVYGSDRGKNLAVDSSHFTTGEMRALEFYNAILFVRH